jgi:hypothetical protein
MPNICLISTKSKQKKPRVVRRGAVICGRLGLSKDRFELLLIFAGCGHVSGLFGAVRVTAGPDEVRIPGPDQTIELGADQQVRHARQGAARVPSEVGQWPGLLKPEIHRAGSQLRPEAGIYHTALPAAERHGRTRDPDAQGAVHPSPTL